MLIIITIRIIVLWPLRTRLCLVFMISCNHFRSSRQVGAHLMRLWIVRKVTLPARNPDPQKVWPVPDVGIEPTYLSDLGHERYLLALRKR